MQVVHGGEAQDERDAARALFEAWHELHLLACSLPRTSWPLILGALEHELTRESVLMALSPGARSLFEAYSDDVMRCRCGVRLISIGDRMQHLCPDCAHEFLMDTEVDDVE